MTTRRTYECNLCCERLHEQDETGSLGKPGVGILWGATGKNFSIKRLHRAENHMCAQCVELLIREWPNPQQELHQHE